MHLYSLAANVSIDMYTPVYTRILVLSTCETAAQIILNILLYFSLSNILLYLVWEDSQSSQIKPN